MMHELKHWEKQVEHLQANVNAIVLEGDAEHISYVGGNVEQIIGYTKEQWLSFPGGVLKFWVEHLHPEDRVRAVEFCAKAVDEGKDHVFEYRMISREGEEVWIRDSVSVEVREGLPPRLRCILVDITGQKQVEMANRERELHYKTLFEDSPISLWEEDFSEVKAYIDNLKNSGVKVKDVGEYFDKHPEILAHCAGLVKIVDVNKATLHLYRAKSKEELLSDLNRVFTRESYVVFKEALTAICEGETTFEKEAVNLTLTGDKIYIDIKWCIAPGFEHNWKKIFISITEITERIVMEEKIKTAVRQWDATFDAINDPISLLDPERILLRCNKAQAKLLGKSFNEIIGHHCYELMNCQLEAADTCPFKRMLKTRQREIEVFSLNESWFEVVVDPIYDESGKLSGAVHIVSDITERRKAEEQIKQQNEFLNTVMKSLTHPFYIVDVHDYKIVMSNPAAQKQGLSAAPLTCYQLTHNRTEPCNGSQHPCPIREVVKNRKPVSVEHVHILKNGKIRNFEIYAYPIFDDNGEVKQVIEYTIDITERRKAEEMARVQQEQLLQADKMISLGILVSGVAHEINNPNNSITLNAQFLESAWKSIVPILDEYYAQNKSLHIGGIKYDKFRQKIPFLFSGILDSSGRIQHIVEELKSFSRKDAEEVNTHMDINATVNSAVNLMQNIIKKSTRNFKVSYQKALPPIVGNYHKLEQVIINLVQNACHALTSPDKGIFISTFYDRENRQVVVSVEDEGMGIPKENLKLILEPFFTTKRNSGGTGLGLSVSSRIVRDHGGTLHFNSSPGKGTTAEIRFPLPGKD